MPAQPAAPSHRVQPGDTLSALSAVYGGHERHWPQLQRLNRLSNPDRLVPGTQLRLPASWNSQVRAFAEAVFVHGQAHVTPPGGARESLAPGMRPDVGSLLEVGADSSVHLRLSDGTLMQLTPQTRIRLDRLRTLPTGATDAQWSLEEGRVENRVSTPATTGRRFEIRTPYAVASVRGTEFAVGFEPGEGTSSEVLSGAVRLRRPRGPAVKLLAGEGTRVRKRGMEPARALPARPALPPLPDQVLTGPRLSLPLPEPQTGQRWRVRVTPADSPEQVLRDVEARGSGASFAALVPGTYGIRLQARGADGLLGPATEGRWTVRSLPPPPLYVSPVAAATVPGPQVELRCSRPEHATAFHLQLATTPDFGTLLHEEPALPECRFPVTLTSGRYYWRVATVTRTAEGLPVRGAFSEGSRFDVQPPGASPAGSITRDWRFQLHWDPHPGMTYQVQVSRDAGFGQLLLDTHTTDAHLTPPDWPAGEYFVRIRAISSQGQHGLFSPVQAVQVARPLQAAGQGWQSGGGLMWEGADGHGVNGPGGP